MSSGPPLDRPRSAPPAGGAPGAVSALERGALFAQCLKALELCFRRIIAVGERAPEAEHGPFHAVAVQDVEHAVIRVRSNTFLDADHVEGAGFRAKAAGFHPGCGHREPG